MVPNRRRVLLLDERRPDDPAVIELAEVLEVAGFSVRVAVPGESPREVAARFRPDVAVVSRPGGGAPRTPVGPLVDELERDYGVPVVVVEPRTGADAGTGAEEDDGAEAAAGDGPGAAVAAPAPPAAPTRSAFGSSSVSLALQPTDLPESPTLAAGDVIVDEAGRVALRAEHPLELTRLEFDLLAYFVRHRNRVLTRTALLAAVWNNEPVTPNAIEALVSKLRAKLDRHGPRLIHTVRGVGYVLRVEGTSPFDARPRELLTHGDRLVSDGGEMGRPRPTAGSAAPG